MDNRQLLSTLIQQFSKANLISFLRAAFGGFKPLDENLAELLERYPNIQSFQRIGSIELADSSRLCVLMGKVKGILTERSSKKQQYELTKEVIRMTGENGGLVAFHDEDGNFRFSLITAQYYGVKKNFSNFRRYTYYITKKYPNKTFLNQIGREGFTTFNQVLNAFSIEAVSDSFYDEFEPMFKQIAASVIGTGDENIQKDFALLFVIRTIFLGFVQKKGWLGDSQTFIQDMLVDYEKNQRNDNSFYKEWMRPLFFEALNNPPGRMVAYGNAPFSKPIQDALQMSPYLNGELFKEKIGVDDLGLSIPDAEIKKFYEFLFQYNFTIEENQLYDEELELNPEFLGIIFERLVNKEDGAVYTPRTEVDFMCRIGLVKWLEKNSSAELTDLYRLLFRDFGSGIEHDEDQKQGDFSTAQIRELIDLLSKVTVCDPAAGSGAFEVGMMHVLSEVLENLYSRNNTPIELKTTKPKPFDLKKAIIANSLYGVEVKRWAVWINHLRLWLSLFVDMPDETLEDQARFRLSQKPLLPNLTFKVRTGDSLVQRIGSRTFPIQGYHNLPPEIKSRLTTLKKKKRDFFYNQSNDAAMIDHEEVQVFQAILDYEIDEKRNQLRKLLAPKPKQIGMDGFESNAGEQMGINLAAINQEERGRIESEIEELLQQRKLLQFEKPFIWTIEFSEIFFDGGGFDIIIGNPPYIRQEEIADPNNVLSASNYKKALANMLLLDFPGYFEKPGANKGNFLSSRKPDGQSDLYCFFYIHALRLLKRNGIHVFICSNSWLDVGYGTWLQEFLVKNTKIHFIFDNQNRRSFANAAINTIISVIDAVTETYYPNHLVKYISYKAPFEDVIFSENLINHEMTNDVSVTDIFRVFATTNVELLNLNQDSSYLRETSATYGGGKWGGKYLRAPDVFLNIISNPKSDVIEFSKLVDIKYGLKTGATEYFLLTKETIEKYNLHKHIFPILTSSRSIVNYEIGTSDLDYLFIYNNQNNDDGVKKYIKLGERNGYPTRPSLKGNHPWFLLKEPAKTSIVLLQFFDKRFFTPFSANPIFITNSFWGVFNYSDWDKSMLVCYLNSSFYFLQLELFGRHNMGEGVLTVYGEDFKYIYAPRKIKEQKSKIGLDFFRSQSILDIFTECGLNPLSGIPIKEQEPNPIEYRKTIDEMVFDALHLSDVERVQIYRGLCELVWNRINRAKSF